MFYLNVLLILEVNFAEIIAFEAVFAVVVDINNIWLLDIAVGVVVKSRFRENEMFSIEMDPFM